MPFFDVNNVTLWVEQQGDPKSPAVLLIHGFPDSSMLWAAQIPVLANAGYFVLAPDLRGFGRSSKPIYKDEYSLKLVCQDLIALLDRHQLHKVHVVGHDWGAATAWRMALTCPQRVQSLAVLSVGHPGGGAAAGGNVQRSKWWYFLFFQYEGVAEKALTANNWQLFREFIHGTSSAGVPTTSSVPSESNSRTNAAVEQYIEALSKPGALQAALNYYRANFSPENYGDTQLRPFPPLNVPTLGVWSEGDPALTERQMTVSEQYMRPGRWRYQRLPRSVGHWIPRDGPHTLNQLLLDFLSSGSAEPACARPKL